MVGWLVVVDRWRERESERESERERGRERETVHRDGTWAGEMRDGVSAITDCFLNS